MKLALIGAGGFAREVMVHIGDYEIKFFVQDEYFSKNSKNIYPLSEFDPLEYKVLVAIGDPKAREKIVISLPKETPYFTFIHPSAQILGKDVSIGEGSMICANTIVTTNCQLGKHTHLNLNTTIGHDCIIGDFFTTAPAVNISGNCKIGNRVYFGTNSSVREKIEICDDVVIGMNSGVVKNIEEAGIYIGTPSKKIK